MELTVTSFSDMPSQTAEGDTGCHQCTPPPFNLSSSVVAWPLAPRGPSKQSKHTPQSVTVAQLSAKQDAILGCVNFVFLDLSPLSPFSDTLGLSLCFFRAIHWNPTTLTPRPRQNGDTGHNVPMFSREGWGLERCLCPKIALHVAEVRLTLRSV